MQTTEWHNIHCKERRFQEVHWAMKEDDHLVNRMELSGRRQGHDKLLLFMTILPTWRFQTEAKFCGPQDLVFVRVCTQACTHVFFLPSKSQSFITAESTQSFRHILLWNIGLEKSTKCQQSDVYRYSILLIYTCDQLNRLIGKCIFRPIYSKNDCNIHRLLIHDKLESIWPSLGYANCSKQAKSTIQHTIVPLDRSTFKEYQFIRSIHYRSGTETQSLIYTIAKKI